MTWLKEKKSYIVSSHSLADGFDFPKLLLKNNTCYTKAVHMTRNNGTSLGDEAITSTRKNGTLSIFQPKQL